MNSGECRLLMVEDNAVNALVVQKMLQNAESPQFQITRADSLVKALDSLVRDSFDVALVDLNLPDSTGLETFLAIQRHAPGLPVVVLSACDNEAIAMQAVGLGAQDYLSKSELGQNELVRALRYGMIRSRKAVDVPGGSRTCDVIGIVGSKGGVGVTTLACHAAREIKRQTEEELLLCGLDSYAAGVAYFMKVQCPYTISDAALNLHRLDPVLWRSFVASTPDAIDILAPPGSAQGESIFDAERARHVLRFARSLYGRIVIDLGAWSPLSFALLEEVTHLYVVSNENLASLWETGRLFGRLTQLGISADRVRFVVNQKKKTKGLSAAELEKALGHGIEGVVGDASDEQYDLFSEGRYIDVKSRVHRDVAVLVAKLLGKESPPPASNWSIGALLSKA